MSLLSHDRYQYDSLILSKQTSAYPRQHLQQLLWCVVSVRLNLPEVEERKLCPLRYYANCVSTTLTVLILHNVESVYFFCSNPVLKRARKQLIHHDVVYRRFVELYCPSVSIYFTIFLHPLIWQGKEQTAYSSIFTLSFWISRNRVKHFRITSVILEWGQGVKAPFPPNILCA